MMRQILAAALFLLGGCANPRFDLPGASDDPALYATIYPYYIEVCAVSAMKKKQGFGFEYQGGPGGHAVVYLNGACRDPKISYPTVRMCDDDGPSVDSGVGLSSNGHLSNAAWVATPGRDFFFNGALRPGERVTTASYDRTQALAKQLGILNGIRFHEDVFDDMPAGMTRNDFMYEASVATDYAISLGRGRLCARLPVTRGQMQRVVAYLNAQNAQYRDGQRVFTMTVVTNNCSHFTHNVLAAAGLWKEWPTDRPLLISALSFPVPKNEFVNQIRRSNDLPLDDPVALFKDSVARRDLLRDDWLPTDPGAIASTVPIRAVNDIYDTDVGLIFYDIPVVGTYQAYFDRVAANRRYTVLADDLHHFAATYARIDAEWRSPDWWVARAGLPAREVPSFLAFYRRYHDHVDRMAERTNLALRALQRATPPVVLAAHDPPH